MTKRLTKPAAFDWDEYWKGFEVKKRRTYKEPTPAQVRRMDAAIAKEIGRLERCRGLLRRNIDADVYLAGMELFATEEGLAFWLCEPAPALGRELPLVVMKSPRGRRKVRDILLGIAHGTYF